MGNSFRPQPFPVIYGENKTPFRNDLLEVGILVAFAMIAFSFLLIIPGIRGWEVSTENNKCGTMPKFTLSPLPPLVAFMGDYTSVGGVMDRSGITGDQLRLHLADGQHVRAHPVQGLHPCSCRDRDPG